MIGQVGGGNEPESGGLLADGQDAPGSVAVHLENKNLVLRVDGKHLLAQLGADTGPSVVHAGLVDPHVGVAAAEGVRMGAEIVLGAPEVQLVELQIEALLLRAHLLKLLLGLHPAGVGLHLRYPGLVAGGIGEGILGVLADLLLPCLVLQLRPGVDDGGREVVGGKALVPHGLHGRADPHLPELLDLGNLGEDRRQIEDGEDQQNAEEALPGPAAQHRVDQGHGPDGKERQQQQIDRVGGLEGLLQMGHLHDDRIEQKQVRQQQQRKQNLQAGARLSAAGAGGGAEEPALCLVRTHSDTSFSENRSDSECAGKPALNYSSSPPPRTLSPS